MQAIQPQESFKPKNYSIEWARSVVKEWMEKNARGSEILCKYFGIDEEILVGLLKTGRPEWQVCKEIAQKYDNYQRLVEQNIFPSLKRLTTVELLVAIIQDPYVKSYESLYSYLTGRIERTIE